MAKTIRKKPARRPQDLTNYSLRGVRANIRALQMAVLALNARLTKLEQQPASSS